MGSDLKRSNTPLSMSSRSWTAGGHARGDGGHGDDAGDEGRQVARAVLPEMAPPNMNPNIRVNSIGHRGDVDELLGVSAHLDEGAPGQRRDLRERVANGYRRLDGACGRSGRGRVGLVMVAVMSRSLRFRGRGFRWGGRSGP